MTHVKESAFSMNTECWDISKHVQDDEFIVSSETRGQLDIVFCVYINCPICVLGAAANVIIIIIFGRQGFMDSVNVSFCSLAISDLCSLLPLLVMSVMLSPLFPQADVNFDPHDISAIAGRSHSYFAKTTSWITAFITFQRCVCVALPMKVKDIITPKRVVFTIATFSLVLLAIPISGYSNIYFTTFQDATNITLVRTSYTKNLADIENVASSLNVFTQLSSFIIIIACTMIMVLKLLSKSKWRYKATSFTSGSDSMSSREKRVMKMVTLMSSIFIILNLPTVLALTLMVHFPSEYSPSGRLKNVYYMSWTMITTVQAVSSSTTILVYYNMSSRFRESFHVLFCNKRHCY